MVHDSKKPPSYRVKKEAEKTMKNNKIVYSVEKLFHFSCQYCNKWFSIADFQVCNENYNSANIEITCPHCNLKHIGMVEHV